MKRPLIAVGLLWSAVVLAQSFGGSQPGGGPVTVTVPDGGLPVAITGTPTVNSQLVAPDGGLRVTLGSDVVPVSGSVSAAISNTPSVTVSGTPNVAVTNTPSVTVSGTPTVNVGNTPAVTISGTPTISGSVMVTNRVDANVTTAPGTYLGVAGDSTGSRLEVAIPAGVSVTNTPNVNVANVPTVGLQNGTVVSLSPASLGSITTATGKGNCTYVEGNPASALGNTATAIPASPMASRTAITVTNTSSNANKRVQCVPGGTASATLGKPIYSGGATWKWEGAQAGWVLSCICVDNGSASTGCTYQSEEERCYQ